jgi:hypothetical protein
MLQRVIRYNQFYFTLFFVFIYFFAHALQPALRRKYVALLPAGGPDLQRVGSLNVCVV